MKLNQDCIRDLLLFIEKEVGLEQTISLSQNDLGDLSKKYDKEDILYTGDKLLEAGLINGNIYPTHDSFYSDFFVKGLTWEGHQFLDNIRDNVVWTKTKSLLSKFSSVSIEIVSQVAANVLIKMIEGN